MAQFVAYPPCRIHSETSVTQEEAQKLVASYLEAAADDPSLHPNALLTEGGPVSATSGTSFGIVLHNLQRLEAGLRGEYLEPELDLTELGNDEDPAAAQDVPVVGADGQTANENDKDGTGHHTALGDGDWQDKEEFEWEQGLEQGEVGPQIITTREQVPTTTTAPKVVSTKSAGDKSDRKQKKKERKKQERRERAEKAKHSQDHDED